MEVTFSGFVAKTMRNIKQSLFLRDLLQRRRRPDRGGSSLPVLRAALVPDDRGSRDELQIAIVDWQSAPLAERERLKGKTP